MFWARPAPVARLSGLVVLALFVAINLRGVTASGRTEDIIVLTSSWCWAGSRRSGSACSPRAALDPLDNEGVSGVFLGAAAIFVAYEGFELLPDDYGDIDPSRDAPFPGPLSLGCRGDADLRRGHRRLRDGPSRPDDRRPEGGRLRGGRREGPRGVRPLGGDPGRALSTSSAINATLFSTARLVRDVSAAERASRLPRPLTWRPPVRGGALAGRSWSRVPLLPGSPRSFPSARSPSSSPSA